MRCGRCCHDVKGTPDDPTYKRIPLYPEELERLETLADHLDVTLRTIEDIVFPDVLNKKIIVLTYRILLDNEEAVCPFHDPTIGCTIQHEKPLACKAYPLAVKTVDAFNMQIEIDPYCTFTEKYYSALRDIDFGKLKEIYDIEWKNAMDMLKRNKRAIFKLIMLEKEGKIKIPRKISTEDFNRFLKSWPREVIDSQNI